MLRRTDAAMRRPHNGIMGLAERTPYVAVSFEGVEEWPEGTQGRRIF